MTSFLRSERLLRECGLASRKEGSKPILWQSCYVLQKKGKYYIVHFKQLFQLDGKFSKTVITEEDLDRTNLISSLLESWGLIKVLKDLKSSEIVDIVILPYSEKKNWILKSKYTIGTKRPIDE